MLRLRLLTSFIVIIDTALFAALIPLLPRYADDFRLSASGAGLLFSAYAVGVLLSAVPAGLAAARFGAKRAALAGLALVSLASIAVGLADSATVLGLARALQGVGSAFSWAGALAWLVAVTPRERRGEMLGVAIGAAVFGALLGPVVGMVADLTSPEVAFSAIAGIAAVLLVWAARTRGAAAEPLVKGMAVRVARERLVVGALWLVILPSLLFGVLAVLVPLRLDAAGWSTTAIGAVFLAAAGAEMVISPLLGRFSDRRGRALPLRLALGASVAVSVALAWSHPALLVAALAAVAGLAFGAFWAPSLALLSDAAERLGLAQGLIFGLVSAAWAVGNVVGPAAAGGLADSVGDELPFLIGAAMSALTLVALRVFQAGGSLRPRVPETP